MKTIVRTREELIARRDELVTQSFWLPHTVVECCTAHTEDHIRNWLGDNAAKAYQEYHEIQFLLGEVP